MKMVGWPKGGRVGKNILRAARTENSQSNFKYFYKMLHLGSLIVLWIPWKLYCDSWSQLFHSSLKPAFTFNTEWQNKSREVARVGGHNWFVMKILEINYLEKLPIHWCSKKNILRMKMHVINFLKASDSLFTTAIVK